MAVKKGSAPDAIEWELRASDGTAVKLVDVAFDWKVVEIPDCDDPQTPVRREYVGPMMMRATVVSYDDPVRVRKAEPGTPYPMTIKHWHDPQAMG